MPEWTKFRIGDVADVFDGPHATPKTVDSGPIFLGISALENGRINLQETRHVTLEDFEIWTRRVRPQAGDVVFSYETRLGQAAIIPEGLDCCLGRRMGLVRAKEGLLDPRFFLFTYLSPAFQDFLRSRTISGATVDRLPLKDFPDFPIPLPDIDQQRAIAETLAALDDKIELNRRMNETLEAMARAIFKDWFVDFGPTRAKMEGCAPYLSADIWSLFPSRLDDDSRPQGWKFYSLDKLATQHTASVAPSSAPEEVFEHFSLPAYDAGQTPSRDLGASIKSNKTLVPEGAILLSKLNPEIERVWVPETANGNRQICSTEFLVFTPKANSNRLVLFGLFTEPSFRIMLQSMVTGTSKSHQRISPPALLNRQVLAGSDHLFARFAAQIEPLLDRVLVNRAEARTLAATRDLLLPKLISGEVRVKDAEKIVGEVT